MSEETQKGPWTAKWMPDPPVVLQISYGTCPWRHQPFSLDCPSPECCEDKAACEEKVKLALYKVLDWPGFGWQNMG